jgi:nascent polypeptide-associated complex subunit alpha
MSGKKMQKMMKQMGIQQNELEVVSVVMRTSDQELIFESPQVSKVNMMGQETYQIVGTPSVRSLETFSISEEDVNTVVEQTGVSEEEAKKVLTETEGDLAEAIMKLKS